MAVMNGAIKPYELRREITVQGGQTTLTNALTAINAEVASKLQYTCMKCYNGTISTGLLNAGTVECDNCNGWGATELQQTPQQPVTFKPNSPAPTETLS